MTDLPPRAAALEVLLSASPDATVVVDAEQRIISTNKAFSELVGAGSEPLDGAPLAEWLQKLNGQAPRKWAEARALALRDGVSRTHAFETSGDGRKRHLAITAYRGAAKGAELVVGVWRDVTEQAKALVSRHSVVLEAVNQVFQTALTSESFVELAETCLTVCQEVTGSKLALIGELNDEGLFDTIAFTYPGWEACRMEKVEAHRLMKGMLLRGTHLWALRDGEARIVNDVESSPERVGFPEGHPPIEAYLGVPLRRGERLEGMIGLANKEGGYSEEDVTVVEALAPAIVEALERKRAEVEAERRTTELRAANEALEQYAHAVSHDLRAPLRAVRQYADFITEDLRDTLEGEQREYLDELSSSVDHAERLVEDLLRLTRMGRNRGAWEVIDLPAVLEEIVDSMLLGEEVRVDSDVEESCRTLQVEASMFRQIVQNLVENAVKFNSSEPKRVELICRDAGDDRCSLVVRDNGIGIDGRFGDRIFEVFNRLHTEEEYEGTGIGLAIVKKAVSEHGGTIRVESEPGRGSTFVVTLPKRQGRSPSWNQSRSSS